MLISDITERSNMLNKKDGAIDKWDEIADKITPAVVCVFFILLICIFVFGIKNAKNEPPAELYQSLYDPIMFIPF